MTKRTIEGDEGGIGSADAPVTARWSHSRGTSGLWITQRRRSRVSRCISANIPSSALIGSKSCKASTLSISASGLGPRHERDLHQIDLLQKPRAV